MSLTATFRKEAEDLVKEQMAAYDPSHDWLHVDRVRRQGIGMSCCVCVCAEQIYVPPLVPRTRASNLRNILLSPNITK